MPFDISAEHLAAVRAALGGAHGTLVSDEVYARMMAKALGIKPSKRERRFKDHVTAKSGMRTAVRFRGGLLYDGASVVVPFRGLPRTFEPVSRMGRALLETGDGRLDAMMDAAVAERATGNHYRNHITRVRLPHFRTAC